MADEALKTYQKAWKRAHDVQTERNKIYERLYQRYKGYNPNVTNPYRSNLVMPKLYTAIETVAPRISKALFGKRPYIPMRSEKNPDNIKSIETVLDGYLYKDKFKVKGGQIIKSVGLFGTAFIEPIPRRVVVTEKRMEPSPVYPWNDVPTEVQIPRFRLDVRRYMPWQVYVEPHMLDLESPGYIIIVEIVPKSEIQRLIDMGVFNQVELGGEGEDDDKKFSEQMLKSINITRPDEDLDYGVLGRLQSKDEYIYNWNGMQTLKQSDNPYSHKRINAVRCVWNQDPMLQNSFWGQPEGKACEAIMDKLDESWNMTFDNHDIINQAVIGYREEAVEPEQIVYVGGARIPIKGNFQGHIRDAIDVIETRGLPADAYRIPGVLDMESDRAMGVHAEHRGEDTPGDKTATESSILASQGDMRNESRAEIIEALGLGDFADKCTSHMDQFSDISDWAEFLGEEALMVMTMNPNMVQGGFDYQFKGSDSIINDFQARADWRAIVDILQINPTVRPDGIARKTLQLYGWNEQEINEVVMSPEEIMMMQQQQQEEEEKEWVREVGGDVIRAEAGAAAKAKNETKTTPKRAGDKKPQKASKKPTMGNPKGGTK